MSDTLALLKQNGKCCISEKPLKESEHLNMVQLPFKASWNYPVWGNFIFGKQNMAVAYVHDDCIKDGVLQGRIRFAVELDGDEIIYHPVEDKEKSVETLNQAI